MRRTAASNGPSAAVTLPSPTDVAGPEVDSGSAEDEGAGAGEWEGEDVGAGDDAEGRGVQGFAGDGAAAGDSGGAGGIVHELTASMARPHPAATPTVQRLMKSAPRRWNTRTSGAVCRITGRSGPAAHPRA
ncbi:hypothetical protein [Streptomyces sp. NPDC054787]